jgi:hypothetical protein
LRGNAASLGYEQKFTRRDDFAARIKLARVRRSYVPKIANLETNSALYADMLPLPFAMRTNRKRKSVKRWTRKSSAAPKASLPSVPFSYG